MADIAVLVVESFVVLVMSCSPGTEFARRERLFIPLLRGQVAPAPALAVSLQLVLVLKDQWTRGTFEPLVLNDVLMLAFAVPFPDLLTSQSLLTIRASDNL